ncbi:MAG: substrate-binding periplasmic protein [Aestuariibacter sp.]
MQIHIVTEHWPPFNYLNDKGEVEGIATDVVKKVMTEAGYSYEISLLSWSRAYQRAKNDKNVLIYTIFKLENREEDFQWICPLIETGGAKVFALASREDIKIESLNDLKGYSVGVLGSGWSYEFLKFYGFVAGEHLDIVKDEMANIRKLFAGRIDLIVQEPELISNRLEIVGKSKSDIRSVFKLGAENSQSGCMAMSLDTPSDVVKTLRSALVKVALH